LLRPVFKAGLALGLTILSASAIWTTFQETSLHAKTITNRHNLATAVAPRPALAGIEITIDQVIASGFSRPVQVTHAGDGSGRLFVVEQVGRIKIIKNGSVLSTPFLNIESLVSCCSERGLLGLAFHPNYAGNGFFYLNYTDNNGDTVIARYTVSGNPDQADASSAVTILTIDQPYSNHNGGQLLFGPDGYLYIGLGDGGSGGDPLNHGQDITTLLGAMLRLDVDSGSPYAIPPGNPYVGVAGRDEIWAIGLRNPWRFSFDRATGDLFIGDVGQNQYEEISYQPAGAGGLNFGWRLMEGNNCYNPSSNCNPGNLTLPIVEYPHSQGFSVTGGFVYRGTLYPALQGRYFYADYGVGKIWSIYKTGPDSWSTPELELDTPYNISAFGEDEQGELYVVDYGGTVRRLADINGVTPNLSTSQKIGSTPHANPGQVVTYTILLKNSNGPANRTATLTDTVPAGLLYATGSATASQGTVDYQAPRLIWQGMLTPSQNITITYWVTATGAVTGILTNQAGVVAEAVTPFTLSHSVLVPRPVMSTTIKDFFLPGTQPGQLNAAIPPPSGCAACHTDPIYSRWRGSMMGQAGRDPLMWAALAVANNDAPNAGEFCLRCHTPKGWLEGRSDPASGAALSSEDISAGVACEVCHRMVDPIAASDDEAVAIDATIRGALPATATLPIDHVSSAMMIIDPEDRRRGPFSLTAPHSALRTDFLGQSTRPVTESRLCGTCHNLDNPMLSWDEARGQYWPNGTDLAASSFDKGNLFPIETTYDEWLNSSYASGGVVAPEFAGAKPDGVVQSCQDCHMRRTTGQAATGGTNRDCSPGLGCLPEHDLVGGNSWVPQILQDTRWRLNAAADAAALNTSTARAREMLQKAATVTVTLTMSDAGKIAVVRVTNQTGHKLPTGYPEGRRLWLNLKAYDEVNSVIYESGVYDPATATLTEDAALKIYEAKQGLTPELASILGLPAGESFHFILNNTVIKDNRIPPRGFSQEALETPGMKPVGATYAPGQYWDETSYPVPAQTTRVSVTLYYQTASKEYIDFLRSRGGPDGTTLGQLWDSSKSPPEMMATAAFPGPIYYLPIIFK